MNINTSRFSLPSDFPIGTIVGVLTSPEFRPATEEEQAQRTEDGERVIGHYTIQLQIRFDAAD